MSPTARGGGAGRGRSAPGEGAAGLQGHPAVLLPPAGEGQTLADQGLLHLVSAGVDDAGAQEHPILRQQSGDLSGQGDDHVGHDVGQHQMIALTGQLGGQRPVGEDISRPDGIAVPADAVEGGILIGHIHRFGVDIDPKAVDVAYENAALNGIGRDRYTVRAGDILSDRALAAQLACQRYHLVLANIVADVIIPLSAQVPALLAEDGVFLCSGIIDTRAHEVEEALVRQGLTLTGRREKNGWVALEARCPFPRG